MGAPGTHTFIVFGAMDVTKPCKFIWFGAMDVTKPYKFIGFGAMDVTKPYEFIRFGADGHKFQCFASPCKSLAGGCRRKRQQEHL